MAPAARQSPRTTIAVALTVVLATAPFLLPADAYLARALATGFAISFAMKLRLLWVGLDADPAMLATLPRFLVWMLVPPATTWPRSADDARQARRGAPGRLLQALLRLVIMLAVVAIKDRWLTPLLGTLGPVSGLAGFWAWPLLAMVLMLEFYLLLTGMSDGMIGLARLLGVTAEEPFVHPVRARGPAEFWALRWNRVVHRFARSQVFVPIVRRRGPVVAVLATFAASGAMHEYLVVGAVGFAAYRPGLMTLFFLLQALVMLAERALVDRHGRRRWPPLLHLAWLTATTPLFFLPLAPQIAAFDASCLRILSSVNHRLLALVS